MKFRLIIDETKEEEVVATVHSPSALTEQLEALVLSHTKDESLLAFDGEQWKLLTFPDMECITVIGGKVYAIDGSGRRFRLKQRLNALEPLLPAYFIRINKSTIANRKRIDRFAAAYSGAVDAIFQCGYREYVSRRCFAQIRRRFEGL